MGKQLESITIYATLKGFIWQGIECTKETVTTFTPKTQPFTRKWIGLRDALLHITDDGDFQNCVVDWGCMVIRWFDGKYSIEREVEIPKGKLTADFLAEG
jgi:hypothetical protein